jgi:hypothetical protein
VAAVLASAAAALLYRSSSKAGDREDSGHARGTENDSYGTTQSEHGAAKRAKRKASAAADTVAKTAKAAAQKAGKNTIVKTAKTAVEKGGKVAVKRVRSFSKAAVAPTETAERSADKRARKAQSHAGVKQGAGAGVQPEPPELLDLTVFSDTEARSIALESAAVATPEATQVPTEEQVAEAHPS